MKFFSFCYFLVVVFTARIPFEIVHVDLMPYPLGLCSISSKIHQVKVCGKLRSSWGREPLRLKLCLGLKTPHITEPCVEHRRSGEQQYPLYHNAIASPTCLEDVLNRLPQTKWTVRLSVSLTLSHSLTLPFFLPPSHLNSALCTTGTDSTALWQDSIRREKITTNWAGINSDPGKQEVNTW